MSDVSKAFATAKAQSKPVFLYWGAVWCPPCNQVKATLFSRSDFARLSKSFVMVHVDGDKPGSQKVAQEYKVRGYPTMVVMDAKGVEITRLPGEVDPERYLATMQASIGATIPAKDLVQRALVGQTLTEAQWSLLAFYSWDTDEKQASGAAPLADTFVRLADRAPAGGVKDRLRMRALVVQAQDDKLNSAPAWAAEAALVVGELAASETRSAALNDTWMGYSEPLVKAIHKLASVERDRLVLSIDAVLARALSGTRLTRAEQLDAWSARMSLDELLTAPAKAARSALVSQAMLATQKIATATTDRYERQAVVPAAAQLFSQLGDAAQSDALLKAELPSAVAPYYHMLVLGGNAKKRKDTAAALDWYEKAWTTSQGAATRAQWGSGFVSNLVDLAPSDSRRIEAVALQVLTQAGTTEHFYARTQRSIARMATKVQGWSAGNAADRVQTSKRLEAAKTGLCGKMPKTSDAKSACEAIKFSAS